MKLGELGSLLRGLVRAHPKLAGIGLSEVGFDIMALIEDAAELPGAVGANARERTRYVGRFNLDAVIRIGLEEIVKAHAVVEAQRVESRRHVERRRPVTMTTNPEHDPGD